MDTIKSRKKASTSGRKSRQTISRLLHERDRIFDRPLPPGIGDALPTDAGILDLQLGQPTLVTGVPNRGTIPVSFLSDDIEVTAALWTSDMGGDGAFVGDVYILRLEWDDVDTRGNIKAHHSKDVDTYPLTSDSDLVDPIVMHLPPAELADVPDDILVKVGILVETAGFDSIFYVPSYFYLDREAPGGSRLPPLELPRTTLTLVELRNELGGKLTGDIADYFGQEPGDIISIFAEPKGGGTPIALLDVTVSTRNEHTRPEFLEANLEKLDPAGTYVLYYYVKDLPGNRSIKSPETELTVWIKDSPVDMPPPEFPGKADFDDEILRDPQLRPSMSVNIPSFSGAAAGQTIWLVIDKLVADGGNLSFNVGTLAASDLPNDPILETSIPFASISPYFFPPFDTPHDITAWYEVQMGALPRAPSDTEDATLLLGFTPDPDPEPDPDPDPTKPENPNDAFRAPLLRGQSGQDDVITVADNARPATVTVYWNDSEGRAALKVGDRLQVKLNGEDYGPETTVDTPSVDVAIRRDPANPGLPDDALEGPYWLYCDITRDVAGEDITVQTPAKRVVFQSAGDLPGGGTLAQSYFIAGARKGPGRYAINGSDVVADNGTDIRCYVDDTGVRKDMVVNWRFEGFLQSGTAAPGSDAEGSFIVNDEDLRPRPDDPKEPGRNRAFRDVHVARANLEAIGGRGKATFQYWIVVDAGTSTSEKDEIVADIRIPTDEG